MSLKPTRGGSQESAEEPLWLSALVSLRRAKVRVVEQHLKSGHPIVIWRDGKVYHQPPEEAKREMDELMKNPNWLRMP